MSSIFLTVGPVLFVIIFLSVWIAGYISSLKLKLVTTKLPFFCQTGDQKPVYWLWVIGHFFTVAMLVANVISQYLYRIQCIDSSDNKWKIVNIMTLIFGIMIAISLYMIIVFDYRRFSALHSLGVFIKTFFFYAYMICNNLLTMNITRCLDHNKWNIKLIITIRWILFVYYFLSNSLCVIYMKKAMNSWQILHGIKEIDDINVDDVIAVIDANNEEKQHSDNLMDIEHKDLKQKMKRQFRIAAVWQYQSLFVLIIYVLTLSMTQML